MKFNMKNGITFWQNFMKNSGLKTKARISWYYLFGNFPSFKRNLSSEIFLEYEKSFFNSKCLSYSEIRQKIIKSM